MTELRDRIQETIEREPVVAFIKGTHEQAYCGNSERALHALRGVGASFAAVDVLPDPAIRQELSALSSWPTIPQVFVGGELIGGADIVQEPIDQPYGVRDCAVRDPAGNLIRINELR